ncbi:hypothetical protein C8R43DRAFT_1121645 [Mycena crocata]|nr:hypothetical protein C8R43DRAFT_1121645 [Mycena crocata]
MSTSSIQMFELPTSIIPSISASSESSSTTWSGSRTLRERCGFTGWLSFASAFPNIAPKGNLEPTSSNLPRRRKRSSVASFELPAPPAPVQTSRDRMEYFS